MHPWRSSTNANARKRARQLEADCSVARCVAAQRRPLIQLALALLPVLAPALNLAAPMAPPAPVAMMGSAGMADAGVANAGSESCTHANVAAGDDGAGCGADNHAGAAHHAEPLCLQCVALGGPAFPGAPPLPQPLSVASPVVASFGPVESDLCHPLRDAAARGCRGPPHAV